jgi:hypothetical protein
MNTEGPIAMDDEPPLKKCKTHGIGKQTKHDKPTIYNDEPREQSQKFTVHLQVYQTVVEKKSGWGMLQTHINFPRFLPIFPDFLEQLSHLAPIY